MSSNTHIDSDSVIIFCPNGMDLGLKDYMRSKYLEIFGLKADIHLALRLHTTLSGAAFLIEGNGPTDGKRTEPQSRWKRGVKAMRVAVRC
jgi:hypothetical protein